MSTPTYTCNVDYTCGCEKGQVECEWYWDEELECWVCTGCAVVQ